MDIKYLIALGVVILLALIWGKARAGFDTPMVQQTVVMSGGQTGNIGGGLLAVGGCSTGIVTVPGVTVGRVVVATPEIYPGPGNQWQAWVSGVDTVSVQICALVLGTPVATKYNVKVAPQ